MIRQIKSPLIKYIPISWNWRPPWKCPSCGRFCSEPTSIAVVSGRTSLRDLGEPPSGSQRIPRVWKWKSIKIFWVLNVLNCGNGGAEAVDAACVCWCSDMPMLAPIRTSNLGPLIPVSSRTLGGSSPISGSHSWTEKGISERVPFFQDGWMIRF